MLSGSRAPLIGLVVLAAIAAVDAFTPPDVILLPLFLVGPLVAASGGRLRHTMAVGAASVVLVVVLGWMDGLAGTRRHSVVIGAAVISGLLASWLAHVREQRESTLRTVEPIAERVADETAARLRAEYLSRVQHVLTRSLDVGEILDRVTAEAVPDIADWCAGVVTIDRPPDQPSMVVAHADPARRRWAEGLLHRFPYDPASGFGAPRAVATGERSLVSGLSAGTWDSGDLGRLLREGDADAVLTVPVHGPLGVLGALQFIRGRARPPFDDTDVELAEELAERCGSALNNAVLFGRQAAGRTALDTLQHVSGALATAVTYEDVARAMVTADRTQDGGFGVVLYVGDEHDLVRAATESVDPELGVGRLDDLAKRCVVEAELVDVDLPTGGRQAIVLPLRFMGRSIGALAFVVRNRRSLTPETLSMLSVLAARCAGALERISLYERERDAALSLQRRLLPTLVDVPPWVEVAARYEPATGGNIGGDWFQLVTAGNGRLVAVVGDAVGHGITSAAAMGQLRASIATAVATTTDPASALAIVDHFAAQGSDTLAASAALAMFEESGGVLHASAGHPPMVLVHDGAARLLEAGRRPLLGFGDVDRSRSAIEPFGPGDTLVMYTDGLIEQRETSIDEGLRRLLEVVHGVASADPTSLCDTLIEQMVAPGLNEDDVAVLVLRHRTAPLALRGCSTG